MKVIKMKLKGDSMTYWLTETVAQPIMEKWEHSGRGAAKIEAYELAFDVSQIKEMRGFEENEPYPDEFKTQLLMEGSYALPETLDEQTQFIRNLPTETIFLDENLKIIPVSLQAQIKKAWLADHSRFATYYQASCHYKEGEKGKEFYLDRNLIKELLGLRFDPEYPEYEPRVFSRLVYGVERLVY